MDRAGQLTELLILPGIRTTAPEFGWCPLASLLIGGIAAQITEDSLARSKQFPCGKIWIIDWSMTPLSG
ncbi:hypothetical protein SSE37_05872 [Sagittula stellata E-37]|uniref:Uncharacterized protein n=1 Tax=Sagittula stellata (strain ATCC 700073 / DSM 11524 / E-37) TaxID=388399 RepID=A3K9L5_SAGS3|nr:hypothetical protein SSE37_05872 [Sagittula stellata E-37]